MRDGLPTVIDAADVVPDDLVMLADGDRVAADMRCIESHGLLVDTSTLTGESVPESVGIDDTLRAGTFVVEGEGRAVVTATGAATEFARIAVLTLDTIRPDTPLTRELHRLVRTIAAIALGAGVGFFLLTLVLDTPPSDGFLFAIGITVALVPEGLLPTVTLSLAIGAQRMAAEHALVRRLESVETLGSTTFICTDKTGTLTQNRMRIVEVWTPSGSVTRDGLGYEPAGEILPADHRLLEHVTTAAVAARGCSHGRAWREDGGSWTARGDPMEAAIDSLALQLTGASSPIDAGVLTRFAFDPRRRRSSVVTVERVLVKGAPDAVLDRCQLDSPSSRPSDLRKRIFIAIGRAPGVTGVRIRIDEYLLVVAVAAPYQRLFADAGPGHHAVEQPDDRRALRATEARITPGNHVGRDAALPVCRSGEGNQAPLAGDEILDLDRIADGEDVRIAGAHVLIERECRRAHRWRARPTSPALCQDAHRGRR